MFLSMTKIEYNKRYLCYQSSLIYILPFFPQQCFPIEAGFYYCHSNEDCKSYHYCDKSTHSCGCNIGYEYNSEEDYGRKSWSCLPMKCNIVNDWICRKNNLVCGSEYRCACPPRTTLSEDKRKCLPDLAPLGPDGGPSCKKLADCQRYFNF